MSMKHSVLKSLPRIYSLSPNSDYSRFLPQGSIEDRAKQRWQNIGERLYCAIETVQPYVVNHDKSQKKIKNQSSHAHR